MIQDLHSYISACPLFDGKEVNVDYLASENGSISISPARCDRVIKSYCGGGSLREYPFILSVRSFRNGSLADGLKNEQLCENLADWAEEASERGNLPNLANGLTAQRLEVLSGGWLDDEDTNHAVYKIELRLIYTKM